ncbi:transposase [Candidatus Gottesmanbacteria bacterium]|nr:transposase [Candidatus Gottesmanbacteria bacterium]
MARYARLIAPNLLYHIMNRGIEKKKIFKEDLDYLKFLQYITGTVRNYDWIIYCYCLLPNHFHLLVKMKTSPLGKIMKSLQTAYGVYFNKKYKRVGPVFAGRYKSIICQKDDYLLQVSKYIHLNPVKANLCSDPLDYPYSSYQEYCYGENKCLKDNKNIIDKRAMSMVIGDDINQNSITKYRKFVEEEEDIFSYNPDIDVFGNNRFIARFKRLG